MIAPPDTSRRRPPLLARIVLVTFALGLIALSMFVCGLVVVMTGGDSALQGPQLQHLEACVGLLAALGTFGCCAHFASTGTPRALLGAAVCAPLAVLNAALILEFASRTN